MCVAVEDTKLSTRAVSHFRYFSLSCPARERGTRLGASRIFIMFTTGIIMIMISVSFLLIIKNE